MTSTVSQVIIVDDEEAIRSALGQSLELEGYTVSRCASGDEALGIVSRGWAGIVVTDVKMPDMDGFVLMARLHRLDAELPVVMLTGHGDVLMAVTAMGRGAYDFIEKPCPTDRLIEVVARAAEKRSLVLENRRLRDSSVSGTSVDLTIIGESSAIDALRNGISTTAAADVDVLVYGETGTGKELVARNIHAQSDRSAGRFVPINCGALPETMIESELFGHEAGAFTGATKRRIGRFEYADGGTIFLDEIETMPMDLQVRLLRVLQEREIERLGSNQRLPIDVRVIAATKSDLAAESKVGRFREDLFYRLNVVCLTLPALRDRPEDVAILFRHFVGLASAKHKLAPPPVSPQMADSLIATHWPGNVRELRNAAERFVLGLDIGIGFVEPDEAPPAEGREFADRVGAFEKRLIADALSEHQGNVSAVCNALGLPRKTLSDKMRKHGLTREMFQKEPARRDSAS